MGRIVIKDDLSDPMVAEVIMDEIFRFVRHDYNLRQATRVVSTGDALDVKIPLIVQDVEGYRNVGELQETPLSAQRYDFLARELHKNVTHLALSKESMSSSKVDIMRWHIEGAAKDINRMENLDIVDVINNDITQQAGNDWSNNANDPFADIMAAAEVVRGAGYDPDQMWLARDSYHALLANSNIVDRFERGATVAADLGSIAGFKIYMDNELTGGTATFIDSTEPTMMLFDGPEWIYDYVEPRAFFEGYIIADFLHVEATQPNAGLTLTGLA